jgi:DivIVA domain-containing protein
MRGRRKDKKKDKGNEEQLFDEKKQPEARRITPVEIQQKEFRLAMRGYHERDVDEFLDEITEEVARLYAENKRLQEETESRAGSRFGAARTASEAEAIIRQARQEAALIIAEAEASARSLAASVESAPAPSPTASGAAWPELASFLSREKAFLQNLARMMQDHANATKEEVRRVREGASRSTTDDEPRLIEPGSSDRTSPGSFERAAPAPDERAAPAPDERAAPPARPRRASRPAPDPWAPLVPDQSESTPPTPSGPPAAMPGDSPWQEPDPSDSTQPPYFMNEAPRDSDDAAGRGGAMGSEAAPLAIEAAEAPAEQPAEQPPALIDLLSMERAAHIEAERRSTAVALPEATERRDDTVRAKPGLEENPYVDEPTREWTLGEGGLDARDADGLAPTRPAAPAVRWVPQPEEEAPGGERSLKELFWGED